MDAGLTSSSQGQLDVGLQPETILIRELYSILMSSHILPDVCPKYQPTFFGGCPTEVSSDLRCSIVESMLVDQMTMLEVLRSNPATDISFSIYHLLVIVAMWPEPLQHVSVAS